MSQSELELEMTRGKMLKVSYETWKQLRELGKYGENMDDIVGKCVNAYRKLNKL